MMNTLGLTEQEKIALKIIEKAFESKLFDSKAFSIIDRARKNSSENNRKGF